MRFAMILSTAMAATAGAQNLKTTPPPPPPPPDTVPFHTRAVNLEGIRQPSITANFVDPIPAGKRLAVQHVSLRFEGTGYASGVVGAVCQIGGSGFGLGANGFFQHFIPLNVMQQGILNGGATFTAGQAITLNLDGGSGGSPITISCSAGNGVASNLNVELTGLLITK